MEKFVREWCLALRQSRELTQDELAAETKISQGLISRLERDPNYFPSVDVLGRFAKAFGMSLSEFFRQIETGSKPATAQPIGPSAPLEATGAEGADAKTLRRIGAAFFAAAGHAATPTRTDRPTRGAGARKSKTSRGGT